MSARECLVCGGKLMPDHTVCFSKECVQARIIQGREAFRVDNDAATADAMIGPTPHWRSAAVPPFERVTATLEGLADETSKLLRNLQLEVDAWSEAYDGWWEVADCWGTSATVECITARLLVAAVEPEVKAFMKKEPTRRDLARWLLEQPATLRMLRSITSLCFCQLRDSEQRNATVKEFLANVHHEVWQQVEP